MPTQEDRVIARIKQISAMIRDHKSIPFAELESWALVNQGIRTKTLNSYLAALISMNIINTDNEKHDLVWTGEKP